MARGIFDPIRSPERLAALRRLAILDTPAEEAFDRLTQLACQTIDVPVALVTIVDEERQFFKSCTGLPEPWSSRRETPLSHSFCQHTVLSREPLLIEDARVHAHLRDNLAIPELGVVAYAGIPLITSDGCAVGSFCVIDHVPRVWTEAEIAILHSLAASALTEIEVRAIAREAERDALDSGAPQQDESDAEVVHIAERAAGDHAISSSAIMNAWLFRAEERPRPVHLSDLPRLLPHDDNLLWIDLSGDTETSLASLSPLLKLHPLSVQAALAPWHRPRLDIFHGYVFINVTLIRVNGPTQGVFIGSLSLFVGRNFVVSVHQQSLPFFDDLVLRAFQGAEAGRLNTGFLVYGMLDELLSNYAAQVESVEFEIENIEERGLRDTSDTFLSDLLRLKRYVFAAGRLVEQHQSVFTALARPDMPFVAGDQIAPYWRDLEVRLSYLIAQLYGAREAVNGAFNIYASHVSHVTNRIMKVLTMISTILLPITVIVGLFGTNFPDSFLFTKPGGFEVMLVGLLLLPVAILLIFRRQRWI